MKLNDRCYVAYGLNMIPPWMVNSGFVVGDEKTLIVDSGCNYLSAQTIHGYALSVRSGNHLVAVNTEPHADHMGGNSFFRDMCIDIYGHKGTNRSEEEISLIKDDFNSTIDDIYRRRQREGDLVFIHTRLVNPNKRFTEDFTLDLGEIEAIILMTPGHTPQNASVYIPSLRTLYCGDTIVSGYFPNLTGGGVDTWRVWLESLERIQHLDPEIIVPGHGEVLRGSYMTYEIERTRVVLEEAIKLRVIPTELITEGTV